MYRPPCRSFRVWTVLAGVLLLLGLGHSEAAGQSALLTSQVQGALSPEGRDDLYRQLESQTEFLQKQAAVIKTVAKLVGPAVVHIEADVATRRSLQHGQAGRVEEAGSGVIIRRAGKDYVLTNRHVIRGATPDRVRIHLADRRLIRPLRIWEDPPTDVAVMAVDAPHLVDARLGQSDTLEIGDFVLAVGSPFGLSHSVTFGIVSAKNRRDLQLGGTSLKFQNFIQTDAAINPGNSGGPLINLRGEVIGINTAIASSSGGNEGIGFAIPISMFMNVAGQLIDKGKVARAYLGVTIDSRFGPAMAAEVGLPRPMGARITSIADDSPARAAGLRINDVILQLDDAPIEDDAHLVNLVSVTPIGKDVTMVVYRDGKELQLKARLAEMADP
ncbi:MAG: trypsin-like peptidase domain-containing protein [Pirellulales bacterium]|nr:trypsin-like peptidase domain-containing protein [Pirellulales bacterium]